MPKMKNALSAKTADRHVLYQESVQNVEAEIDFVDEQFHERRGRQGVRLREDFCGTANTSCEWVRRRPTNVAVGVDLDRATLDWGLEHNIGVLEGDGQDRVSLLEADVRNPGPEGEGMDIVLAMNFSYWILTSREAMVQYFRSVHLSLVEDGIFFLDFYGGYEAAREMEETREQEGFDYVWDQAKFNPVTGLMSCFIHFEFPDGSRMDRAYSYEWRLWTLPEIREMLAEAGFAVTVYLEEADEDGEGNGVFYASDEADADAAFLAYIVAER